MLIRALQAAAGNFGVTGYAIDNSLRFNDNDSAYLSRTPSVAGNRKTWTWSGWVKRGNLSGSGVFSIFQQRADSDLSQQFGLQFRDDAIRIIDQNNASTQGLLDTTAVFRDVSGWYHIVVSVDTTDATTVDRVKLYVNGDRITSFSSPDYWPLNYDTSVNNTVRALIGVQRPNASATLNNYFDGYMAEINLIDGQALTADDFGEINATTGEWSPKRYAGTYGTNGFYLNFIDPLELGKDASENLPEPVVTIQNDMETAIPVFSPSTGITQSTDRSVSGTHSMRVYRVNSSDSLLSSVFTSTDGGELSFYANIAVRGSTLDDTTFTFRNSNPNVNPSFGVNFYRENDGSIHYYRPTSAITGEAIDTNVSMSLNVWYKFQYLFDSVNTTFTITNISTGSVLYTATSPHYGAQVDQINLSDADSNWTYYIDDVVAKVNLGWASKNLASTDQMIDTSTNNFSVLNSTATLTALSEGNLQAAGSVNNQWQTAISGVGVSSGKWYFEAFVKASTFPEQSFIGITQNSSQGLSVGYLGSTANSWGYYLQGNKYNNSSGSAYGAAYTTGDVVALALDMDAGSVTFYKNNVSQGVAYTGLTGTMFLGVSVLTNPDVAVMVANFGADSSFAGNKTGQGNTDANGKGDFYYAPPTGYLALCTDNLPAPAIEQPETQFNVVTYTGNGTSQSVTGVGFQPDFVWIKKRNTSDFGSHQFVDIVRGLDKYIFSDATNAEVTAADRVTSFDSDGFSLSSALQVNENSDTYVAWCWKAGGTAVTNTDGSITSQVSANVDAGFSIVGYTGTGSAATVGHGLNSAPDFTIIKNRDLATAWIAFHSSRSGERGILNGTNAFIATTTYYTSDPTDTVLNLNSISNVNGSGDALIAYCFHSVEGFSKFGSYVGNGSTDGTFVYTGFKPSLIMTKRTNSAGSWEITDSGRSPSNVVNKYLYANLANADSTFDNLDFLSNGFKFRNNATGNNNSGDTYIYMAFAEHPFNYATGR